jgi:hypothetical protein
MLQRQLMHLNGRKLDHRRVMAAGPRYIASARTVQKTPLPTVHLLLRKCLLRRSRDGY